MTALKVKMCANKNSFRTRAKAEEVASKFGQRVYECPICFCWHCTSKEDWQGEFINTETAKRDLASLEMKLRTEFNSQLRAKNIEINDLKFENSRLRDLVKKWLKHKEEETNNTEIEGEKP